MNTVMTGPSSTGQAVGMEDVPDPQVPERARRRTYTAKYKRDILTEYDSLDRQGRGALLRREKLYTSLVSAWRDQRDRTRHHDRHRPRRRRPEHDEGELLRGDDARARSEHRLCRDRSPGCRSRRTAPGRRFRRDGAQHPLRGSAARWRGAVRARDHRGRAGCVGIDRADSRRSSGVAE